MLIRKFFWRRSRRLEYEAQTWLARLQSGHATTEDAQAFKSWYQRSAQHAKAYDEARDLWQLLGPAARNVAARSPGYQQPVARHSVVEQPYLGRRALLGGAVAASAGWLLFNPPLQLWPALNELGADYRTITGERRTLRLSENLQVDMNTQTRLNRLTQAGNALAFELLDGEAVFQAQGGDTPLWVMIAGARLESQDALFNVRHTGKEVRVTCLHGQLELRHASGNHHMHGGQQLVYDQSRVHPGREVDIDAVVSWREGWLVFQDVPIAEAIDEINRYRPGRVVLRNPDVAQRRIRGRFAISQLKDMPAMISDNYGLSITSLPGGIVLLS